ncbi:MAG: hypothetical protein DSY42_06035 [Aquifex sp.]|nr:MAG: hypothetical protein DSY42_06035 [Aquifex sp.]
MELFPRPLKYEDFLPYLYNNPDLRVVEKRVKEAATLKKVALSEFFPTLDFFYINQVYEYAGKDKGDWYYGILINFPLFDFGKRIFNYKEFKERYLTAKTLKKELEVKLKNSIISLVDKLNAQYWVIQAKKERLNYTKKVYEIEKEKYFLGRGNMYDLLKAEADYYTSLSEYEESILRWAILKANLDYMVGK